MTDYKKWLLASDLHFPKHDRRAIDLFLQVVKWWQPDTIDFAGDLDDAECSGRWVDGTPAESVSIKSGADQVKEFLSEVSKLAKKADDKHFHGGNHDYYRHKNYLLKKAPNTLDYVTPDALYGLSDSGFMWHDYELPPVERLGGIYVHHGEAISKHSGESVRTDVSNHMVSLIRGHSHRAGSYFRTYPLAGLEVEGYEIGHMTDPKQHTYQTTFDWQLAFAVVHVDNNTSHVNLIRIKDYVAFVDGKKFES
jgi:Zn-finger nucleic acid-binding protein